jgi:hypothetical protein
MRLRSVFQNAKARLQEAKTSKDKDRVEELQQLSVSFLKFEEAIAYGLDLALEREPLATLERQGTGKRNRDAYRKAIR